MHSTPNKSNGVSSMVCPGDVCILEHINCSRSCETVSSSQDRWDADEVAGIDYRLDSYLLAVWPGIIYITFLCLSFRLCKVRMLTITPTSKGCGEYKDYMFLSVQSEQ